MPTPSEKARRDKAYQRFFDESFARLRKRGLSEYRAGQIAREVAEETLKRIETPVYRDQQHFSEAVGRVCRRLSEGASYYVLIGEMPYLATARIDRVVAVARRTDPPVEPYIAGAAKRATRVERLSAGTALLFTGLALGTLGLWWAIGTGMVIAALAELYVQAYMPSAARHAVADLRVPLMVNVAAAAVLVYFGYRWITLDEPRALFIVAAAVALLVIAFIVPGITIARLVGARERRLRKALEERLLSRDA